MMFTSIAEVRAANAAAGRFFFSPSTMRFFKSRICSALYVGGYFITSESSWDGKSRVWSVRRVLDDASIDTPLCHVKSKAVCVAFIRKAQKGGEK